MITPEENSQVFVDRGETKELLLFGGKRATGFIRKVVAGELVDKRRYKFDAELVMGIHNRVSMIPGVQGFLRETDSTTLAGRPVSPHEQLKWKFYLFGVWLEEQMKGLRQDPENLIRAIEVAAAAHYGLVMHDFHPFDNGNGRTGRALMNAILMSQSYELTAFRIAIPPIPIVRDESTSAKYIAALRAVDNTRLLNPFMSFIAQQWIKSLQERFENIYKKGAAKNEVDRGLVVKLERRLQLLEDFVNSGVPDDSNSRSGRDRSKTKYKMFPVPDYFKPSQRRIFVNEAV